MPVLVVLVRTHNPGNIGAAARAAKNFGAELLLLGPRAAVLHPDAVAFASGAEDLLRSVETLTGWDAIADLADDVVALTSLRGRVTRGLPPPTTFEEISRCLRRGARGRRRRVALVFGPERGGLTTEELRSCDARLRIAARHEFPTLNLAQSVAIALSALFPFEETARRSRAPSNATGDEAPAPAKDLHRLFSLLEETLSSAGYPGRGRNRGVVAEIESFLKRGRPTGREVTLLLGALAAIRRGLEP